MTVSGERLFHARIAWNDAHSPGVESADRIVLISEGGKNVEILVLVVLVVPQLVAQNAFEGETDRLVNRERTLIFARDEC